MDGSPSDSLNLFTDVGSPPTMGAEDSISLHVSMITSLVDIIGWLLNETYLIITSRNCTYLFFCDWNFRSYRPLVNFVILDSSEWKLLKQLTVVSVNKMRKKNDHTVVTVKKFNRKIVERGKIYFRVMCFLNVDE